MYEKKHSSRTYNPSNLNPIYIIYGAYVMIFLSNFQCLNCLSNKFTTSANSSGSYTLQSAIQKIQRPRLFHPFFGLAYKGSNSAINITIKTQSIAINLLPSSPNNNWTYFSKNLTSIVYNWNQGQEFQVKIQ